MTINNTAPQGTPKPDLMSLKMLAAICAGLALAGYIAFITAVPPTTLPDPSPSPNPSPSGINTLLDAAFRHGGHPGIIHQVALPYQDMEPFQHHLTNITIQKGWYAHRQPPTRENHPAINVTVPVTQASQLNTIPQDPLGWITRNLQAGSTPRSPAKAPLVNVQLQLTPTGMARLRTLRLAGAACWILATLGAIRIAWRSFNRFYQEPSIQSQAYRHRNNA